MKNKFYYIMALSLIVALTSCDYLDVPFDNRTDIHTEEQINKLLVAAYTTSSEWVMAEFSSDNVDHMIGPGFNIDSSLDEEAFNWAQITGINQDTPHAFWGAAYGAIANANLALISIERLERENGGLTHTLRALRAEALMTRAYNHFLLASIFCMPYGSNAVNELGVYYMTHIESTVAPQYSRGNLADLFYNINRDIVVALPHIVDGHLAVPQYRFNRRAAHAFAARFNLHYRRFEEVVRYANVVLGSNPAAVLRDWQHGGSLQLQGDFRPNWFVMNNHANLLNTVASSRHFRILGPTGLATRFAHNQLIASTESSRSSTPWPGGHRFPSVGFAGGNPKIISFKFTEYFRITDPIAGIGFPHIIQVHFTTDETLLMRAEALVMLGRYQEAVNDMNTFMVNFANTTPRTLEQIVNFYNNMPYHTPLVPTPKKRLMNPDSGIVEGSVQENLLHAVLHLRRILTMHEGLRWQDIRRHGIEIVRRDVQDLTVIRTGDILTYDDPRRAIQIPETVAAAGVEQNPRR